MADRYGPRLILGAAVAWWSVFTGATGLAYGLTSFSVTRFLFGVGEAAAFPAASRAILPWLTASRRAFGQGFQHAGSRLGAAVTPPSLFSSSRTTAGRQAFFALGIVGTVLAAVWVVYFRNTPEQHWQVNAEELSILRPAGRQPAPREPETICSLASNSAQLRSVASQLHVFLLRLGVVALSQLDTNILG